MPPPGPGVRPPFAAPPSERNPRLWIGLVVGGLAVLLCCGGGLVGLGGFFIWAVNDTNDQAKTAVSGFLDALRDQDYGKAYDLQCARVRQSESEDEFTTRATDNPRLVEYQLSDIEPPEHSSSQESLGYVVPSRLGYANGSQETLRIRVISARSGRWQVCGLDQ